MSIREVKHRLPEEMLERFYKIYSPAVVDCILRSFERERKTSFRINSLKGKYDEVIEELRRKKMKIANHSMIKRAFLLTNTNENALSKLRCYDEGKIYVQNISSMLPPLFLEVEKNHCILDMCAAPGSKTSLIADLIENKGKIIANEKDTVRLERLKYNLEKQGVKCVSVENGDGKRLGSVYKNRFHRILLDAPCSGEGTISLDEPQSYRGWSSKKVNKNSKLQKRLIDSGVEALKQGGILIYSTCTISPEENEDIIQYALENHKDIKLEEINIPIKNIVSGIEKYNEKVYSKEMKKTKRVIPNEYMEGFYIAKLRKI